MHVKCTALFYIELLLICHTRKPWEAIVKYICQPYYFTYKSLTSFNLDLFSPEYDAFAQRSIPKEKVKF